MEIVCSGTLHNSQTYIYDFVSKGVYENRTIGVDNNVAGRLKIDVFLECAQSNNAKKDFFKAKDNDFCTFGDLFAEKGHKRLQVIHKIHRSLCLHFCTNMHKIKSHY